MFLLAMYPLGAERNCSADVHFELLKFVFTVVSGHSMQCSVAIIRDNCNKNLELGRHFNVHFVGWHSLVWPRRKCRWRKSSKLKSCKRKWINSLFNFQKQNSVSVYILRKKFYVSRWSSMYEMWKRYVELHEFITLFDIQDICYVQLG